MSNQLEEVTLQLPLLMLTCLLQSLVPVPGTGLDVLETPSSRLLSTNIPAPKLRKLDVRFAPVEERLPDSTHATPLVALEGIYRIHTAFGNLCDSGISALQQIAVSSCILRSCQDSFAGTWVGLCVSEDCKCGLE